MKVNVSPRVTIVVVTYNSSGTISRCLAPLKDEAVKGNLEVIVMDNVSKDETVSIIREKFPWSWLIVSEDNIGFGRAVNHAMERSSAQYALVLNPDGVMTPDDIYSLSHFIEQNPEIGVVSPSLYDEIGETSIAGLYPSIWSSLLRMTGLWTLKKRFYSQKSHYRTNWVVGAALLVRRDEFLKLGGYPEDVFLYGEDTEICRKFSDIGLGTVVNRRVRAWHEGGVSSSSSMSQQQRFRLVFDGELRFLRKYTKHPKWAYCFSRATEELVKYITSRDPKHKMHIEVIKESMKRDIIQ